MNNENNLKQFFESQELYQSNSDDAYTEGKRLLTERGLAFLETEEGKAWFRGNGKKWLEIDHGESFTKSLFRFLGTKEGKIWLQKNIQEWLKK